MSLADERLKEYDNVLTVNFLGKKYPVYVLMEHLLKVTDKDARCVRFVLWDEQIELYKEICKQRLEHKPVRINILKARQIGYSTFIAGLLFIITLFTPNIRTGVIADTEAHAKNLFSKYEYFYRHLDDNNPNIQNKDIPENDLLTYKPKLDYARNQTYMKTKYSNSEIEVLTAGDNAGRSNNFHLLHCSECAFYQNLKLTLNSLLETVSNNNLNSMIFLETTGNGFNEYKERWDKDLSGKTSYKAFFSPWWKHEEYKTKGQLPRLEEWLYQKQSELNLSDEQMNWIWNKYLDKGDKALTLQEYPFTPVDAFLSTGNCLFNAEIVAKRKEEIIKEIENVKTGQFIYEPHYSQNGDRIELLNTEFVESRNGLIKIYKEPIDDHPYVGVCDPNDEGSDYNAVVIIDNFNGEQVASFITRELTHDKIAYQFYLLGKKYNDALLSNEMNRGGAIMDYLIKLGYPKLYVRQDQSYENYKQSVKSEFGHKITKTNRNPAIESFKIAFKENPRMINDFDTICQMETFSNVEHVSKDGRVTYKIEASGGNHDDLVMAMAGYYIVRNQQSFLPKRDISRIKEASKLAMFEDNKHKKSQKNILFTTFSGIRF